MICLEEWISFWVCYVQDLIICVGVNKDGSLMVIELVMVMNMGVYGFYGLMVVCNIGFKFLLFYCWFNMCFDVKMVYINLLVGGVYCGYGVIQGQFVLECVMDELVEKLGMDFIEF